MMTTNTEPIVINVKSTPAVANTVVIDEPMDSPPTPVENVAVTDATTSKPVEIDNLIINDGKNEKTTESDTLPSSGVSKKALNRKPFGSAISLVTVVIAIIPFIGWRYADKCPFNWHIPHYLVVSGIVGLTVIILNIVFDLLTSYAKSKLDDTTIRASHFGACCGICGLLVVIVGLIVFFAGWSITGCIWIFRAWNKIQYENADRSDYCHPTLYRFAYWLFFLSIIYILIFCCRTCAQTSKQIPNKKKGPAIAVLTTEA
ncbi:unnamed protein product [Rotaria sp. Silwood2]|nr:unnamed protein product [Rotaria sp. Silwood2]CAF2510900.1 unnamed protein product [Rotaria sp. Silwood2]CAF2885787.1 unnamed protein product [Rotaria sp. Silwood2]CAF4030737.1 unnamed protein product [Rotaria sp. Silwood2]CAF4054007.1 unnamed protein product [Rotaria sp. Silwood2]